MEFEWVIPDFILRCDFDVFYEDEGPIVVDSQIFTTERTSDTVQLSGVNTGMSFSVEMTCFYDYLATKPTATRTDAGMTLGCWDPQSGG